VSKLKPGFVIHGGAGKWENRKEEGLEEIDRIANSLEKDFDSEPAVQIVEEAVRRLESNKVFNAGKGAKLELDGEIRLDASIMKSDLNSGSIIGLEGDFTHPVSVAKKVMDDTHHVALKGEQASNFASEFDFEEEDLEIKMRHDEMKKIREKIEGLDYSDKIEKLSKYDMKGTVGAVAIDVEGRMAAATSTGGVNGQLPGRIGDTPMPGCGTFCNSHAAVSATGTGEAIIKTTLSRRTAEKIEGGESPQDAVEEALDFLTEKTGSEAGLISLDKKGRIGVEFNSENMIHTNRRL
jgi:beta-aspartyl-peptidase (threonine type)